MLIVEVSSVAQQHFLHRLGSLLSVEYKLNWSGLHLLMASVKIDIIEHQIG